MKVKIDTHFLSYLGHLFLEREMFQTEVVHKSKNTFYVQQIFLNLFVHEEEWQNMIEQDWTQII